MRAAGLALLAVSSGCDNPFGFGGQDLEGDDQLEVLGAETDNSPRAESSAVEAACLDTGGPMDRGVTAFGGAGSVAMQDSGLQAQCCAEFSVEASVSDTLHLDVTYVDGSAEPCDCSCPWSLSYTISALEPGDWTIVVDGIEALATVR